MRHVMLCVAMITSAGMHAAEDTPAPATPNVSSPDMPWRPAKMWTFNVEREETAETKLDGRAISYKDRGPARTRMHVIVEPDPDEQNSILVRVPSLEQEEQTLSASQRLKFDPNLYELREEGRRLGFFESDGDQRARKTLHALTQRPWFKLTWQAQAWVQLGNVAQDAAWPIADRLALERELALLLPAFLDPNIARNAQRQQTLVLPYPAPLTPQLIAPVTYRVSDVSQEDHRKRIDLSFTAAANDRPADGIEWGGIRIADAQWALKLEGQASVVPQDRQPLKKARLSLRVDLLSDRAKEAFVSHWTLESRWKSAP